MFEGMHVSRYLFFQAAFYYCLAASSRHPMAQYRYARYLLRHRAGDGWDGHQKAVTLLEQAAVSGIIEVSVHSVRFHGREPCLKGLNHETSWKAAAVGLEKKFL